MSRSIVVTGGARGIGREIAQRLAADGSHVVAVDLEEPRRPFENARGTVRVLLGDAGSEADMQRAAEVAAGIAPLEGWVNNAAQPRSDSLADGDLDELWHAIELTLRPAVVGSRVALRAFLAAGTAGAIVNISSLQGHLAFPRMTSYGVAKAAIEALTRAIAVDYGNLGIRANAVAPGTIGVERYHEWLATMDPEEARQADASMGSTHPLGRVGAPAEVAAAVAFLLSAQSSFISGTSLAVDGGRGVHGIGR